MNQQTSIFAPSRSKYLNTRHYLLLLIVASALTIITVILNNSYFLISSYITQLLMAIGSELTYESGDNLYLIISAVLAVIFLIPYLLCYIFSKKRVGWMVAALVIYGLESLVFWSDFLTLLLYGDFSGIVDCVFRIFVIVNLILSVRYGFKMKNEEELAAAAPIMEASEEENTESGEPATVRTLTVTRKKNFTGSMIPMVCYANGTEICTLKNGESATVQVTGEAFELLAELSNQMVRGAVMVPEGSSAISYRVVLKMGVISNSFVVEPDED